MIEALNRDPDAVVVAMIRHGRTAANAAQRFVGRTDVPLDEVGLQQAAKLGVALEGQFDRVYASPLKRAWRTAQAVGDPVAVDDFMEFDQGDLEGMDGREAIAKYSAFFARWSQDPGPLTPPGGRESFQGFADRVTSALGRVVATHDPGQRIAVVAHQLVIATTGCRVYGDALSSWREHAVDNTGVSVFRVRDGVWERRIHGWLA